MTTLKLDWCSYEAAKYAVEHWHYSKTMPKSKLVKVGVWEDGRFIGVVLFGVGATPNVTRGYGLEDAQIAELVRVALTKHVTPVSRIVAVALKMLRKQSPGLRLLVSYADPDEGHHGGIYQAGNWCYVGQMGSDREILVDGVWKHRRAVGHSGTSSVKGRVWRPTPGKHKYLYPLDDAMRKQIAPLAKPYPKRVTRGVGETDNAPQTNEETDGASPITPL